MQSVVNQSTNWVSFTTLKEATDVEIRQFAEWNNSNPIEFLYVPWQSSNALKTSGEGTLVTTLKEANYEGFCMNYAPDVYTATLVMATAASIDWNRANSVVSYAFRKANRTCGVCN